MNQRRALIINDADNVATAMEDIAPGEPVTARRGGNVVNLVSAEKIPFGFKLAVSDIPEGQVIFKYGAIIGRASCAIKKGELVHVHNVEGTRGRGDLAAKGEAR